MNHSFERVCIVGLGLIGGSVGLAIKRSNISNQITGYARSNSTLERAIELGLVDKLGSLDDAIDSMVSKLELEDYKTFSYNSEVEFEDYLNSLMVGMLPDQAQGLLSSFSGLNRLFLSDKDRYLVAYCFDCGFRYFK